MGTYPRRWSSAGTETLQRLCSLNDGNRRRLYDYVAGQGGAVSRDEAATACGMERATAAYHLDRLVDDGLLAASYARPAGRGGPGAGRPAKHYQRTDEELAVSVPPRDYRLLAEILARAVTTDESGALQNALDRAAAIIGEELATTATDSLGADLRSFLEAQGFEPFVDTDTLRLRNCPFHLLAQQHTELICSMNRALLDAVAGIIEPGVQARLDPAPDRCCVAFDR